MNIQIVLLLVIMGISLLYTISEDTKANKRLCVGSITVILACFSGFRSWWLGDLIKYYTLYRNCNSSEWKDYVFDKWSNIGIRLFFRGAGSIGISYDVCIFIIAAFFAVCLGMMVYRYCPVPYMSYLIFISMGFYIFTYSGLKQTIAMGFIILAMMALLENKLIMFIFWVFIAFIFHAPAAIFLAAYPIAKKRVDKLYIGVLAAIVVLVFLYHGTIVSWLSEAYYEDEEIVAVTFHVGGRTLMMIFIMAFGVVMRPLRRKDSHFIQVFNIMVMAAIIQVFSMYNNVFSRLADYYYQFVVLFLSMVMEPGYHQAKLEPNRKDEIRYFTKESYVIIGFAITVFSLWYYHSYVESSSTLLQSFKFFWQIDPYALYET